MVSEGANEDIAVQLQLDRKVSILLVEIGCQELFFIYIRVGLGPRQAVQCRLLPEVWLV